MKKKIRYEEKEITHISVLSLTKFCLIFGGLFGLVISLLILTSPYASFIEISHLVFVIYSVVVYAISCFIGGAIMTFIFNFLVKYIGGVKIKFKKN